MAAVLIRVARVDRLGVRVRFLSSGASLPPPTGPEADKPKKTKDFWNVLSEFASFVKRYAARTPEERQASLDRISDELNKGYFDDAADIRRTGGKHSVTIRGLIPANHARPFPPLALSPLKEGAAETTASSLAASNAATLVLLGLRDSARPQLEDFSKRFAIGCGGTAPIPVHSIYAVERAIYRMMIGMITRNLRAATPPDAHDYIWMHLGDASKYKSALSLGNIMVGYVYLLDRKGRIRWMAHGAPSDAEIGHLVGAARDLAKQDTQP